MEPTFYIEYKFYSPYASSNASPLSKKKHNLPTLWKLHYETTASQNKLLREHKANTACHNIKMIIYGRNR